MLSLYVEFADNRKKLNRLRFWNESMTKRKYQSKGNQFAVAPFLWKLSQHIFWYTVLMVCVHMLIHTA